MTVLATKRRAEGAFSMVYGVVALIAFFVITGVGLIIIYAVDNTVTNGAIVLTGNSSATNMTGQYGNVSGLFNSLTGAYLLLPIVGIVLVASMIVGGFFLFIKPA